MLKCKGLSGRSGAYKSNLILFHWCGGDQNSWNAHVKEFEKADICCWTFTLPGRTIAHEQLHSVDSLAEMCIKSLKVEISALRGAPLTLLGHR